ncbi:MAG TPA: ABC transporter substrate-binding protein, partial [Burkholderiales bacterium]|nr:ABC transporter substrate-binding protein [Burkholderiales bacterium]
ARPPINRLAQLRGKRVGVETEAEGGYILARILDHAGLKEGDLKVVELTLEEHEQAYRSGKVDALITMDPVRARLLTAGANELFSSKQIAGELVDLLLVREGIPDTHARALQSLVNAHFRALDSIRANPDKAAGGLPPRFGPQQQLLWSWAMMDFSGRGANLRLLDSGGLRNSADRVTDVMQRRGLIRGENVPRLELEPRFVANAGR